MSKLKPLALILTAAALLAAGYYLGRTGREEPHADEHGHEEEAGEAARGLLTLDPAAMARFELRYAEVKPRSVQETIEATGSVSANESRLAHVRPMARGRIEKVNVGLGDEVRAGQPLLTYDNVELGETLGQYVAALAEIQKSAADTEVARRALERARALVDLGALADAELQRREAEHKNALAETASRRAKAAQVEEKLHRFGMTDEEIGKLHPGTDADFHREASRSVLKAPFSGMVTSFHASPGEIIDPENELMVIADLDSVWALADVYEKDIRFVREGSAAEVRVAAQPDRVFTGKITKVGDVLDPKTRTAKVRVEVPNPQRLLKLEMFATIRIPTPAARPMLMIPSEALHQVEGKTVAFVRKDGGFEMRPVQTGERAGGWVEIAGGLLQGEVVVTEGSFLLKSEAMKANLGHAHGE